MTTGQTRWQKLQRWWEPVDNIQVVLYIFEVLLSSFPIIASLIAQARHQVDIQDPSGPFLISSFVIMSYTTLVLVTTFSRERRTFTKDSWAFFMWGATFLYDLTLTILLFSNTIQPYQNTAWPVALFVLTVIFSAAFRLGYIWRDEREHPETSTS